MASAKIRVDFVGNHSLECTAGSFEATNTTDEPASTTIATSAAASSSLKPRQAEIVTQFSRVLLDRLETYHQTGSSSTKPKSARVEVDTSSERAHTFALQAILLDNPTRLPTKAIQDEGQSPEQLKWEIVEALDHAGRKIEAILNVWKNVGEKDKEDSRAPKDKKRKAAEQSDVAPEPEPGTKRSRADTHAQEIVPKWYGHRCALTNKEIVDAGHIFPVGVRKQNLGAFWAALGMFWPLEDAEAWEKELAKPHVELRNIIPLSTEARRRWDRHYFALRPIKPISGDQAIYVQLCWTNPIDTSTGQRLDTHPRDYIDIQGQEKIGGFCDWRDITDNGYVRAIRSGDVFRITTSDPNKFPLPSYDLLALQWALHRVLGALKASGALRTIFSDPPPPDAPSLASRSTVDLEHSLLAYLADVAEERGVLTPVTAAKWRGAIVKAEYERLQAAAENLADYAENRGERSLFALPPLQSFDEFLEDSMVEGAAKQELQEQEEEPEEQPGSLGQAAGTGI